MDINIGTYPHEFTSKYSVNFFFQNDEFQENISDLFISYDWHVKKINGLQTYTFVSRFTDQFLDINQRYEVSGGLVYDFPVGNKKIWKKKLPEKGKLKYEKVKALYESDSLTYQVKQQDKTNAITYQSFISDFITFFLKTLFVSHYMVKFALSVYYLLCKT